MDQFAVQGLDMLYDHPQFEDKSVSVEAGLTKMLTMMPIGKFKVVRHLNNWFAEFRICHRKDGKVVREFDDLMSATRHAVMMLRFATCVKNETRLMPGGRLLDSKAGSGSCTPATMVEAFADGHSHLIA